MSWGCGQQKQRTAYRHWVSYFSHGCDGISITNSLRKERFILAHSLKMQSIMVRKGRWQEQEAVGHIVSQSRGAVRRGWGKVGHLILGKRYQEEGSRERKVTGPSYGGAGSDLPNSSDFILLAPLLPRATDGLDSQQVPSPSHPVVHSPSGPLPGSERSRPEEGSGRSSSHLPRLSVPSSRALLAPFVSPPLARRRFSERRRPGDRH